MTSYPRSGLKCLWLMQYGSVEYHKQSLRNLQAAVRKTRRLCAVVLDTFGRELVIRREYAVDEKVEYITNSIHQASICCIDHPIPLAESSLSLTTYSTRFHMDCCSQE